jgi:hypothetical protein
VTNIINGAYLDTRLLAASMGGSTIPRENKFYAVPCTVHGVDRNPSAYVYAGRDGRLHAGCFARCAEHKILAGIADRLGITLAELRSKKALTGGTGSSGGNVGQAAALATVDAMIKTAKKTVERQEKAVDVWDEARPLEPGDLADRYLQETRGLDLPGFPETLRLHPGLWHGWSNTTWPALVAAVTDTDGSITGVHRTWLDPATAAKAAVEPQKASLGELKYGAVRLIEVEGSDTLIVAEGIETALAAWELWKKRFSVWAAISVPGLEALIVPPQFKRVLVAADHDSNGAGQKVAKVLAHRLRLEGRQVAIHWPETPDTDWADYLLSQRAARAGGAP